jgi:DNA-binding response OmpR family regulator
MATTGRTSANASTAGTILLVERDILVRMTVGRYLRACGLLVIEAVSAEEARQVLGSDVGIDAVLATLDSGEGFELARWVRRVRPSLEFVLVPTVSRIANEAHRLCGLRGKPHHRHALEQQLRRLRR